MTTTTHPFTLSPPPTCVDGPPERLGIGYAISHDTTRGLIWFQGFDIATALWSVNRKNRVVFWFSPPCPPSRF